MDLHGFTNAFQIFTVSFIAIAGDGLQLLFSGKLNFC